MLSGDDAPEHGSVPRVCRVRGRDLVTRRQRQRGSSLDQVAGSSESSRHQAAELCRSDVSACQVLSQFHHRAGTWFLYVAGLISVFETFNEKRTATHDYAALCRGLCTCRVFHPAQRPVERVPA